MIKLKPLSHEQSVLWHSASLTFGLILVFYAVDSGYFSNPNMVLFAAAVFIGSWLLAVVGMRFCVQDTDPTTLKSIFGVKDKK